jgi:iron complex outermembrane recepter protein
MKNRHLEKCVLAVSVTAASLSGGFSTASAQSAGSEARPSSLEEIVVTARRREESAQTVPVSVSAFSAEALEQRSIENLEDLTRVTPGLRFAAEGGAQNTTISLRGLSKIPVGDGTPAVVTYFADVPLSTTGTNLPNFDLASVQVLKGPQGTLFGRNTIGGAVLVTPTAPTYDFGGYASATVGNYNSRALEGAINAPLIDDKVALRLSAQSRQRDGFTKNIGLGPDLNDADQYAVRASLLAEPTNRFRNTLILDYFKGEEAPNASTQYNITPAVLSGFDGAFGGLPVYAAFQTDLANQFAAQRSRDAHTVNLDAQGMIYDRELWGVTNRTEFDFSDTVTLRNILGYRATKVTYHSDIDGGPTLRTTTPFNAAPLLGAPFPVLLDRLVLLNPGQIADTDQISDELQLLGTSFDNRLTWIIGAFYSKEAPAGPQGSFFHQFDVFASATPAGEIHLNPPAAGVSHTTSGSRAAFGQIGLDLSRWTFDGLTLNLGYRYTWDDVEVCGGNIAGGGAFTTTSAPFIDLNECEARSSISSTDGLGALKTETSAPTWTVGLDYQISPDVFTYIVTRRGYRQGGINTPVFESPCTNGPCAPGIGANLTGFQYIKPEEVTDIEVGLKSTWEAGQARGRVNVSAFTMDYKDAVQFINVSGIVPATDPAFPTRGSFGLNAADLTIRGAEFEAVVSPVEALTFTTTVAYIDQSVDQVSDVLPPFALTADQVTLPTPEWSASVGFRWRMPFHPLNSDIDFGGDYFWTDDWQSQGELLPSYDVVNFRLDWDNIGGKPVKASAFITNASDEEYILSPAVALGGFPFNSGLFGPPRMYGLELTYRFGG